MTNINGEARRERGEEGAGGLANDERRELQKWREWKPTDEALGELKAQAGDFSTRAATSVYVAALERCLRDYSASAEPQRAFGPIREAAEFALQMLRPQDREKWASISAIEDRGIRVLCERFGYGAVMDSASRQWYRKDPVGALVISMAAGTERSVLQRLESALLGEAPPKASEAEHPSPNSPPGATVQPPSKKKESHEQ